MPYRKGGVRRRKRADLTERQYWELVLGPIGDDGTDLGDGFACLSAFESEAERKAAWKYHRVALLSDWPQRINPLWGERTYDRAKNAD